MQICQFNFVNGLNSQYNLYIVLSLQEIIERRKKLTKKLSKPEENLAFDPNTNKIVPIKTDLASLNSASTSTSAKKSPIRKKRVRKSRWSSGFIAKPKAKPKPKEKDEDEDKDEVITFKLILISKKVPTVGDFNSCRFYTYGV